MAHRPGAGRDACVEGGIRESDPGRGHDGADGSRAGRLIRHVLGLYLGWFGEPAWFMGRLLGFVSGRLVTIGLVITRKASRKTQIRYGPYMVAGALVAIIVHPGAVLQLLQ